MSRRIEIGMGDEREGATRFIDAWRAAEAGSGDGPPQERLVFEDLETLLRCLTPARWTLLGTLRRTGPSSVRGLAKALRRDYKNVHSDVRLLERLGLVDRTEERLVRVPWEVVVAEMRLAA